MGGQHARFSPSTANRRLNCPPSLVLEEQFADEESHYAAEGSAGHKLAEHLIKKQLNQRSKRPVSDYFTEGLIEAVDEYVSFVISEIEEAKRSCDNPIFIVEHRVDVSEYVDECFGTADMIIVTDKVAHIIDLKLGKGVLVFAEANPQLMIYGLGILGITEMLFEVETVRLTIFQPRLCNSSTWDITPEALKNWGEEVLKPRGAMALMGAGEFKVGNWCRFCKARSQCRARAEEFRTLAKLEFRQPALLSDDEILDVLKVADELAKWADDVYSFAQDQAITLNKKWAGFKLVQGRSVRKFINEDEVTKAATDAGYTDIYKHSLLTISELEKRIGKKEFNRILGHLVYKPQGKITLVPESDKREFFIKTTASAEFQEV